MSRCKYAINGNNEDYARNDKYARNAKHMQYTKIIALVLAIGALCFAGHVGIGITANAQPGTPSDPLVSRSYLDARIASLEAQIAALAASGTGGTDGAAAAGRELFSVVRAEPGSILIGGASAEIILRSGEATVVAGLNGLVNVTAGHDVMNGQAAPINHLLIVPAADGRGLRFHTVCYLMVKGDFHFE